ncbi:uncharacterized protein LOC114462571 [Gouania willdenowi]|uniref:uncharacterized protein LOC114462571 n=1 Tax=Gouania willdenowi TaxID=441366 RepID=UPI0010559A94|nr:uncharacterized protein LOC114462571 [Gouania willdenowi]
MTVQTYQTMHDALLREYRDSLKTKNKNYRVEVEKWKQRKHRRRDVYVSSIPKAFDFKKDQEKMVLKTLNQSLYASIIPELTSLWKTKDSEVVIAVLPSHIRGNNLVIRNSELRSLRPHQWLNGKIIEGLFHLSASQFNVGNSLYLLNYFTAGVTLFGERSHLRRQGLSKINFNNYEQLLSFVNVGSIHWKLLYIVPAIASVFLVDPAASSSEEADSEDAAKRVSEYFKMRRICYSKEDWGTVKWRGSTMHHPVQRDGSSCGVIVTMMARAVMEAFPALPVTVCPSGHPKRRWLVRGGHLHFRYSVLQLQCDSCDRWFHEQCLGMSKDQLRDTRASDWNCPACT